MPSAVPHSKVRTLSAIVFCISILSVFPATTSRTDDRQNSKNPDPRTYTIRATAKFNPWLPLQDGFEVRNRYVGAVGAHLAEGGYLKPLSVNAGHFDTDRHEDLICGYGRIRDGVLIVRRTDPEAISPRQSATIENVLKKRFPDPFLDQAVATDVPVVPDFLKVADFNRDGYSDAATAGRGGSTLAVLFGNGRGGFREPLLFPLPGKVLAMTAGRFDNDPVDDVLLAVEAVEGTSVLRFLDNGSGFESKGIVGTASIRPRWMERGSFGLVMVDENGVMVICASDPKTISKTETVSKFGRVRAVAVGNFLWDSCNHDEIAVLSDTGEVAVWSIQGMVLDMGCLPNGVPKRKPIRRSWPNPEKFPYKTDDKDFRLASFGQLIPARLTSGLTDDLVVIDGQTKQVRVLVAQRSQIEPPRFKTDDYPLLHRPFPEPVVFETKSVPKAVFPMRLNVLGIAGMVVLREGEIEPSVMMPAPNAVFDVTSTVDSALLGSGSLRQAVMDANRSPGPNLIRLKSGTYTLLLGPGDDDRKSPMAEATGDLDLVGTGFGSIYASNDTTILGDGPDKTIIQSSDGKNDSHDRIFDVEGGIGGSRYDLALSGLTLRGGKARMNAGNGGSGGAVRFNGRGVGPNDPPGTLFIDNCVIEKNSSERAGGGLDVAGRFRLSNSVLSENRSVTGGGGLAFQTENAVSSIDHVTVTGNEVTADRGAGGGIFGFGLGTLFVADSTIDSNRTSSVDGKGGGAWLAEGSSRFVNCTVSGNVSGKGGGLGVPSEHASFLLDTTVAFNTAREGGGIWTSMPEPSSSRTPSGVKAPVMSVNRGGGVWTIMPLKNPNSSLPLVMRNTLIAANIARIGPDTSGGIASLGNNLIQNPLGGGSSNPSDITGVDPQLLPLASYGGPTETHAFSPCGPARDAGTSLGAPEFDQRGIPTINQNDIGAFEQVVTVAKVPEPIAELAAAKIGKPYSQSVLKADSPEVAAVTLAGELPPGLRFDETNRTVTGVPTKTGSFPVAVTVSNRDGCSTRRVYTLAVRSELSLASEPLPPAKVGEPYVYKFRVVGATGKFSFALAGKLPEGIAFDPQAGVLAGTPNRDGVFPIKVTATDSTGSSDVQALGLVVRKRIEDLISCEVEGMGFDPAPSYGNFVGTVALSTTFTNLHLLESESLTLKVAELGNGNRLTTADDFVPARLDGGKVGSFQTLKIDPFNPKAPVPATFVIRLGKRAAFGFSVELLAKGGGASKPRLVKEFGFLFDAKGVRLKTETRDEEPTRPSDGNAKASGPSGFQGGTVAAVNPANPRQIAVVSGDLFERRITVGVSDDGGQSWREYPVTGQVGRTEYFTACHPSVAFNRSGDVLVGFTLANLADDQNMLVVRNLTSETSKYGQSPRNDMVVGYAEKQGVFIGASALAVDEKDKLVAAWEVFDSRTGLHAVEFRGSVYSSTSVTVVQGSVGQPSLVALRGGKTVLAWNEWSEASPTEGGRILCASSSDGKTFSSPVLIGNTGIGYGVPVPASNGLDVSPKPFLAVDPKKRENPCVTFTGSVNGLDVFFSSSENGGESWLPQVVVTDSIQGHQFLPSPGYDSRGRFFVTYSDTRDDPTGKVIRLRVARADSSLNNWVNEDAPTGP